MPLVTGQEACPQCRQPVDAASSSSRPQSHVAGLDLVDRRPITLVLGGLVLLLGLLYALGYIPRAEQPPTPINITVSPSLTNTLNPPAATPANAVAPDAKSAAPLPASPAPKVAPASGSARQTSSQTPRRDPTKSTNTRSAPRPSQKTPIQPSAEEARPISPREVLSADPSPPPRPISPREVLSADPPPPPRPVSPTEIPLDE